MMDKFDYNLQPGKEIRRFKYKGDSIVISVIIPYYNAGEYIEQSLYSVLNQTYPFFEVLIINDGSTDKDSLKKLDDISKLDKRIKVFNKENAGLAATRDYGAEHASKSSKYLFFLDADDLIEPTYLECTYWTLETHPEASWAYGDVVGFGTYTYLWNKWFDSDKMKKTNELVATAMIRKDVFNSVNGYELRVKAVNEDWNFWLKLLSKGYYPVHMSYYSFWYRRKETGSEFKRVKDNQKVNSKIINETVKKVTKKVNAIQYPLYYSKDNSCDIDIKIPTIDDNKINILMIIPWMVMGGADKFNLDFIKGLDKEKYNIIIVSTIPSSNSYRQLFEQYATVYDLTSFLDQKDWLSFIEYIINKNNIKIIYNTNSECGYAMIPYLKVKYPNIPIVDYVHMEEWYYKDGGFARFSSEDVNYIDMTYVCNSSTKRVLENHFKRNKEEIKTIYIGVDENKYDINKFNKKELLKKYNIVDNKYIISYICRISSQKRPMLLAEIIKKTISKRKDILFLIIGDGDMLSMLKKYITNNKLDEYVRFFGNISNTEEIYAISDMTINCSIKEGLALTSYESLAMGVPVLSSDVGGQSELIDDNVGKLVPCMQEEKDINNYDYLDDEINNYVDGIDYIINNIDKLKNNCRKKILNNFTIDNMINNMSSEFNKVINKPNKDKINNGKNGNLEECKEKLFNYYEDDSSYYAYLVREYQKEMYGRYLLDENGKILYNAKKELLKEKLWQHDSWRKITSSKLWKSIKKLKK